MAEEVVLYEATLVEAGGDDGGKREFAKVVIEVLVSTANMRALREDEEWHDAKASHKVMLKLVDRCQYELLKSRPWKCGLCRDAPAVHMIGSSIGYLTPRGRESPRILDNAVHPTCGDSACFSRASRIMWRATKEDCKKVENRDDVVYVYTCNHCGKEESDGGPKLLKCSRCRNSWYCGASCQRADWEQHKPFCSKIEKRGRKK